MITFAPPDHKKDIEYLKKYFLGKFLPDWDDGYRDEDEEAAREREFEKLSELAKVVDEVKKGLKKKK